MPNTIESKSRKAEKNKPTRICARCKKVKDLSDFYANRDWEEQAGKDCWCKDCVGKCSTKDEIREYFWENNREWNERIWEMAKKKAEAIASNNVTYQKTSDDRRKFILDKLTCQQIPTVMTPLYKYVDNSANGTLSYQEAKEKGEIAEEEIDENIRIYSPEFNGKFNRNELEWLHKFYKGLEEDFDLTDTGMIDNARKYAKAALLADRMLDKFSNGQCDISEYKDALAMYDLLSKSGNFAPSKRKPGDNGGISSWSEITAKLESTGHPCTRKIEWPKDDVDRTSAELRYIVEALNLEAM